MIYGCNDRCLASRAYIFRQVIAYVNAYFSSKLNGHLSGRIKTTLQLDSYIAITL